MPSGINHQSRTSTKLLNLGEPGSGKTGALACLADAGYRLVIVDFDNGLDILINLLRKKNPKALAENVFYETFTDSMKMAKGTARGGDDGKGKTTSKIVTRGQADSFVKAMSALDRWRFPVAHGSSEYYDLGSAHTWGPETILVIDSLGLAGRAALRFIRQLNMHQFDEFTSKPDYGQAMERIEGLLEMLYDDGIRCNVIVNTHITYVEDPVNKTLRGLPRALGSKLPPNVGGYFNTIVRSLTREGKRRVILTKADFAVELKMPLAPGSLPSELPIDTGLLTIFNALREGIEK